MVTKNETIVIVSFFISLIIAFFIDEMNKPHIPTKHELRMQQIKELKQLSELKHDCELRMINCTIDSLQTIIENI